jgi:hypothetical protein
MNRRQLVLDNSVLSAFASGNWFHNLSFWDSEYDVLTTERIWNDEFTPHHGYSKPDWLTSESVDTDQLEVRPVELGEPDWTLVRLAETLTDPVLVSNDQRLIAEAENRDIERMWGTKFLIQTFEACGIDEEPFNEGLSAYIADVHLPDSVAEELQVAEKV